jgi:hypothetical protein
MEEFCVSMRTASGLPCTCASASSDVGVTASAAVSAIMPRTENWREPRHVHGAKDLMLVIAISRSWRQFDHRATAVVLKYRSHAFAERNIQLSPHNPH